MLRALFFTAFLACTPLAAETVTILSTQSWVEPDEGEPFFRLTTPDWTAEIRGTEDEDIGVISLAPLSGLWRHESAIELNARRLPYVVDIGTVLHCDAELVVVASKVNYIGPGPAIVFERMLFDPETGASMGTALDTISQSIGGLMPAVVIRDLFPDC